MTTYAIIGSRDFGRLDLVRAFVRRLREDAQIVTGDAAGVDLTAKQEADDNYIPCRVVPAAWGKLGKRAGVARNPEIILQADKVVAFWDKKSRGTKNGIDIARRAGLPLLIVFEDGTHRREEPEQQMTLW